MLKRLGVALAAVFVLATSAFGAGTLPGFSLSQQIGTDGRPLAGCILYIIQAGTTSTPQIAYQDSALTIPVAGGSQLTCDAAGRISQFFLADGSIKIRLVNSVGVTQFTADGLLVVGPSGGTGGGSAVDPTTVLQTGWIQPIYGTGVVTGFVRANGRTIGSATSGATERANADCLALFTWLYADPNLAVSGGRGVSAAADWAANKTIALPDWRGRNIAGLTDMGNVDNGVLPLAYYGTSSTVLGAGGGGASQILGTTNLPPYTPSGSVSGNISGSALTTTIMGTGGVSTTAGVGAQAVYYNSGGGIPNLPLSGTFSGSLTGTAQGGTSANFSVMNPSRLATIYIKL